jgi:DNA-binding CsgD family transcriptional regulator
MGQASRCCLREHATRAGSPSPLHAVCEALHGAAGRDCGAGKGVVADCEIARAAQLDVNVQTAWRVDTGGQHRLLKHASAAPVIECASYLIMNRAGPQAKTSATSIVATQRRAEMLRLRLAGHTLEQIGEQMDIQPESVYGVISRALQSIVREPGEELLALELARCDALLAAAMAVVDAFHPLVQGGRVMHAQIRDSEGQPVTDVSTGQATMVALEDAAPKLAAINTALRVIERRAKLLGLDGPTKIAATVRGERTEPAVVFYLPSNGRDSVSEAVVS